MSRPWTRRPAVLGGGAVALLLFGTLLGVLVVRFTEPAPADPMASMSGMGGSGGVAGGSVAPAPGEGGAPIPEAMLTGMLQAAHRSYEARRYEEALAAYQAIVRRVPDHPEALTHLGVILAVGGQVDAGLAAIERALALRPEYSHARWDRARLLHEFRQDYAAAVPAWERVIEVLPLGEDHARARAKLEEARARATAPKPQP